MPGTSSLRRLGDGPVSPLACAPPVVAGLKARKGPRSPAEMTDIPAGHDSTQVKVRKAWAIARSGNGLLLPLVGAGA